MHEWMPSLTKCLITLKVVQHFLRTHFISCIFPSPQCAQFYHDYDFIRSVFKEGAIFYSVCMNINILAPPPKKRTSVDDVTSKKVGWTIHVNPIQKELLRYMAFLHSEPVSQQCSNWCFGYCHT